jgi:hypothetical protein
MYGYSSSQRNQYQNTKRIRIFQWVVLVLFVATVALAILFFNAVAFRNNYHDTTVKSLSFEIDSALNQVNNLSRTGGTSTSSVLSRIRQHVYAAQVLVDQNAQLTGNRILTTDVFTRLLQTLDTFDANRLAGQATLQEQTILADSLTALDTFLEGLAQ